MGWSTTVAATGTTRGSAAMMREAISGLLLAKLRGGFAFDQSLSCFPLHLLLVQHSPRARTWPIMHSGLEAAHRLVTALTALRPAAVPPKIYPLTPDGRPADGRGRWR